MSDILKWLKDNASAISPILTMFGWVVGALIVGIQLSRQHQNSLKLQRDNAREALKLRIYEALNLKLRAVKDAKVDASNYVLMIATTIDNYQSRLDGPYKSALVNQRAPKFLELDQKHSSAVVEVMFEMETWQIAFPESKVFQIALSAAMHDVRVAFNPLFTALVRTLPMDPPEVNPNNIPILVQQPLTKPQLAQLEVLESKYREAMADVECYIHDLQIEAQNNLLFGLFDQKVPRRVPIDPRGKVISTDPEEMKGLIKSFEEETPWGESKTAADKSARESVSDSSRTPMI